ncbi:MAG: (2Fe-2S)-binding protein [Phycisphaeraceae bacterium]|nr:(2Fe-2S)-binding protein [Phycisphaeraceae bacterium]
MDPDEDVCLCFHVSLRKIRAFLRRERPTVASRLSECLGAGTGCGWCVRSLTALHGQWASGEAEPDLGIDPQRYAEQRAAYRQARREAKDAGPAECDGAAPE